MILKLSFEARNASGTRFMWNGNIDAHANGCWGKVIEAAKEAIKPDCGDAALLSVRIGIPRARKSRRKSR